MSSRKTRPPRRYEGGDEEREKVRNNGVEKLENAARRTSTGRMTTRSDIVVEKLPRHSGQPDIDITKHNSRDKPKSVVAQPRNSQGQFDKERRVTLDSSAFKPRKDTDGFTPARSTNGSVSGTSSITQTRKINTRSKGTST